MNQAKIGIFFIVQGHLLVDATPIERGELYGDAINFSGHFDYWEELNPVSTTEEIFKSYAYDHFPRGRVVYFVKTDSFKLYADCCISNVEIEKVSATFQLPTYKLARDEHYQCAMCNPDYLD